MKRIAYFGGSFDPVHNAHLRIAQRLPELFRLDEFNFVPAFHAPHKPERKPLSSWHRFAMLTAATEDEPKVKVSTVELDRAEPRYTIETATELLAGSGNDAELFFVIGGDSWRDITTWRDWETLLTTVNFIVVARPGAEIEFSHVTPEITARCEDLRGKSEMEIVALVSESMVTGTTKIYFTDAVKLDIAATEIRGNIKENAAGWRDDLPGAVAKYIEKYQIYK
jgi:nicotinate-nucleotide adenylyltransferase